MRAALYARYSTDQQNPASLADQLRDCRALAARLGAEVAGEYTDAETSGYSTANRPGMLALLAAAEAGGFDLVITEHLDRLARSGRDTYGIRDDLAFLGVDIHTTSQGLIDTAKVGVTALYNAMTLESVTHKVSRGLEGVVLSGRATGRRPYGYRKVVRHDPAGEPIRGLVEIDPQTAPVVVRIFAAYAAGASPRAIVQALNADAVPSPTGGLWNAVSLRGETGRGGGILRNPIYAGQRVWRRSQAKKNPRTGRYRRGKGAEARVVRLDAPELRIVPAPLWTAVQARLAAVGGLPRPEMARRPKRLLSGLVRCGGCGGTMTMAGPGSRFMCLARRDKGPLACPGSRTVRPDEAEARVIAALQADLLHPAVVEASVRELQAATRQRAQAGAGRRAGIERELGEVTRRAARLVDQVADGHLAGRTVKDRLEELEARRAALEADLEDSAAAARVVEIHPRAADLYRQRIEGLQSALGEAGATPEGERARQLLREVVRAVRVIPLDGRGNYELEIEGDLGPLFQAAPPTGIRKTDGLRSNSIRYPSRLPVKLRA